MTSGSPGGALLTRSNWWALPVAVALAVATLARLGLDANGICWAAVQVLLVGIAVYDLVTRRIRNVVTVPVSLLAIGMRLAFERSELGEVVIAGVTSFLVFVLLAFMLRGGFGMGDVKLAAMLGFLLGSAVLPALLIGTLAGGVAAIVLVAVSRANLRVHIAYGPYLALGGSVAILFFNPPNLV